MPPALFDAPTPRAPSKYSPRASNEEDDLDEQAGSWLCRQLTPFANFLRAGRPAQLLLGLVGFEGLGLIIYGARFIYIGYVEADASKQPCVEPTLALCWDPRNAAAFAAPLMVWGAALIWLVSDAVNSKSTVMLYAAGFKCACPREAALASPQRQQQRLRAPSSEFENIPL